MLYITCYRDCCRSAIDGAAKEDVGGGLYDSEDDLLESSEEEDDDDDDLDQKTQRMPEPRAGGSARPKGTPTPSGNKSSSLYDTPLGNSGPNYVSCGEKSHIRTKAGVRPTVAFQMQEMEGRPSEDDQYASSADGEAKNQSDAGKREGGTGGTADFMREYMVSASVADYTFPRGRPLR